MAPTEYVTLPIHVLQALLKQPPYGEQWRRCAAREYINREIKQAKSANEGVDNENRI